MAGEPARVFGIVREVRVNWPLTEAGVGTAGGRVTGLRSPEREGRPSGGVVGTGGKVIACSLVQGRDSDTYVVIEGGGPAALAGAAPLRVSAPAAAACAVIAGLR